MFTQDQQTRYERNILLPGIGAAGQLKIRKARLLVIGTGGLGSPAALYLAAAGAGTIGLADFDRVELSNLQRQILHTTGEIGDLKTVSAEKKIRAINPEVSVITYNQRLTAANINSVIREYDFIIEATDNFDAKFLINDTCLAAGKMFSHAGIREWEGQTMTVNPLVTACYRCVFLAPPPPGAMPASSELGVLGAVAGILGSIQAAEALKVVTGCGQPLFDSLLFVDALAMDFRRITVKRNPACPVCGHNRTPTAARSNTTAAI